jgi:pyruvate/2-oxoglutarate dehydrogenase complex dihydrolipoamide dehydrogenase (E3) component
VGRRPNGHRLGAEHAGVAVSEAGYIPIDAQMRTNVPHIFAIGDIARPPLLAHKAAHEGRVAAEVIAGHKSGFEGRVVPSVAYTDPEIAWVGLTETEAVAQGIRYGKGVFPWAANGRSLSYNRSEGLTKLIFYESDHRLLGMAACGPNAGDLIAEGTLAIEMGCDRPRHRAHHPPPSHHPLRDRRPGRRGLRGHGHGSLSPVSPAPLAHGAFQTLDHPLDLRLGEVVVEGQCQGTAG